MSSGDSSAGIYSDDFNGGSDKSIGDEENPSMEFASHLGGDIHLDKTFTKNTESPATKFVPKVLPHGRKIGFNWTTSKGTIPKQRKCNKQTLGSSALIQSFTKSFDEDLHLSTERGRSTSKTVNPPNFRMKNKPEPVKKSKGGAYDRRTRPHVPLASQCNTKDISKSRGSSPQSSSYATRKLLSARKLKIDDLHNRIIDLERQLVEEEKEKRILLALTKRQQKELEKVDKSKMDIPDIEKAHSNEIRALKALMRKVQDQNRELEMKLKNKDEELLRRFGLCQKLKVTLQQKKRAEGESDKKMNALKVKIQKQENTIKILKENINNLERRLSQERIGHETSKNSLKSLKKKCEEMKRCSTSKGNKQKKSIQFLETNDKNASNSGGIIKETSEETHTDVLQGDNIHLIESIEKASTADNLHVLSSPKNLLSPKNLSSPKYLSPKFNKSHINQALVPFLNKEMGYQAQLKTSPVGLKKSFRDRMCSSADSSGRHVTKLRSPGVGSIDVPLIIPSSVPKQSPNESDSSGCELLAQESSGPYSDHTIRDRFPGSSFNEQSSTRKR